MGLAFDSIGVFRTSGGAADTVFTGATTAPGDSLQIRAFAPPASAKLVRFLSNLRSGSALRVRSPLLHDNVAGLQFYQGATNPSNGLLGEYLFQQLQPQDTLVVEQIVNAITQTDSEVLGILYQDLPGAAARLHSMADIANLIKSLKTIRVATVAGTVVGSWVDTALNATETLLHANTDYALLGYVLDTAITAVGIKGIDTSNLRVVGPGVLDTNVTHDYFVNQAVRSGLPMIPVFNAANVGGTFVSCYNSAVPPVMNVELLVAELAQRV